MLMQELSDIMDDLTDDELKKFKWHLKVEKVGNKEPIKASKLNKADQQDTVELMCQQYEADLAVVVTKSILKKMNRNDLVTKLSKKLGAEDPSPAASALEEVDGEKKLKEIRSSFIDKVSEPFLRRLLDKLLEREVLTEAEREAYSEKDNKGNVARKVIDTVRHKGSNASSIMIAIIREEDKYLAQELKLV